MFQRFRRLSVARSAVTELTEDPDAETFFFHQLSCSIAVWNIRWVGATSACPELMFSSLDSLKRCITAWEFEHTERFSETVFDMVPDLASIRTNSTDKEQRWN
jgi:hypothetical protein